MPRNALVIEKELLATPMGDADPRLFEILTERAERDLARVVPATQLAAQVATTYRRLLIAAPNRAQAADVAEALGTSVRSLNRGLAEEDTSFRVIEADVKRVLANEYLEDRSRSLDDVATALGFASANAFIRAYKRWTGLTPARART
jgi:AraC-like DNA-binding protein